MIRLALHVTAGPRGGPRTYGVALAQALAKRGDVDLVVLTDRPDAFPGIPTVRIPRARTWADRVTVPRVLRRLSPDVYHNTKNALPPDLRCPAVVTIHDLAYHHFPETFGPLSRAYLRFHHRDCARRASRVIAVSEHARADVVATLGVPEERVRAVPHGVADAFRRPARPLGLDLEQPYVLSVGTIQARKNLDVLVDAVALLRGRGRGGFGLVVAGRRGWKTRAFDAACRRTPVRRLGLVPDAELPALYGSAAAFVQPSSYEGFGLTVVEAMACGAPVVAAEAGSLPEVTGDAALLVPPRDAEALARALDRVLSDLDLAAELRARGRERAKAFTWERSAGAHVEVYLGAVGQTVAAC